MKNNNKMLQGLILIFTSILVNSAYALDNTDSPDLIKQLTVREKPFKANISKPAKGTRDTIRAYHEYKLFLDTELNKAYDLLNSILSSERQKELKISQQNWIKFRDAEFELIDNNWSRSSFGSSFVISRGDYSSTIIRNRLIQLLNYAKNY